MSKTRYQLSPQYELVEDADYLAARGYNSTALWHKADEEFLLLNPVIATFLKVFQQPATLNEVVRFFQKDTTDSFRDVAAALKPFFTSMRERGVLENCKADAVPKPQMPNGEGLRLGDYTLKKRLSCSPPIDIYLATDDNGRKFLLKRLLFAPNFSEKYRPKIRRAFAQEFKILKILRGSSDASSGGCPNICSLIFFDKQQDYAVIDFFEGDTLRQLNKQQSPLSLEEKAFILRQILETAAFMHQKDILHGDWHYQNVLINDNNVVKVIDFDLAFEAKKHDKRHVLRGGLKEFIPPERIDDSAFDIVTTPPDFRAEVFQIGVLAYYLFFGDYPFKGETWKKLAKSIQNDPPNWAETDASDALIDFLNTALAKNPQARFASAVEMKAAFVELGIIPPQ